MHTTGLDGPTGRFADKVEKEAQERAKADKQKEKKRLQSQSSTTGAGAAKARAPWADAHVDIVSVARTACRIALHAALDRIIAFHWTRWQKKITSMEKFVEQEDLAKIVHECEELMYAPLVPLRRKRNDESTTPAPPLSTNTTDNSGSIKLTEKSRVIRMLRNAIHAKVKSINSPRSSLSKRAQGAKEGCNQQ